MGQQGVIVGAVPDPPPVQRQTVRVDAHPVGVALPIGHHINEHRCRARPAPISRRPIDASHIQPQPRRPGHHHRLAERYRYRDFLPRRVGRVPLRTRGDLDPAHRRRSRVPRVVGYRLVAQSQRVVARRVLDRVRPRPVAHPDPRFPVHDGRIERQRDRSPAHRDIGNRSRRIAARHREVTCRRSRIPVQRLPIGQRQRGPVHRRRGKRRRGIVHVLEPDREHGLHRIGPVAHLYRHLVVAVPVAVARPLVVLGRRECEHAVRRQPESAPIRATRDPPRQILRRTVRVRRRERRYRRLVLLHENRGGCLDHRRRASSSVIVIVRSAPRAPPP